MGDLGLQGCLERGRPRLWNINTDKEPTFPWACMPSDRVLPTLPCNCGDSGSILGTEKLRLNEVNRLVGGDIPEVPARIRLGSQFGVKIATLGVN